MKECCRCGNRHIGFFIYAPPAFMFLFAQEVEQWRDMNLDDDELASIRSLHMVKPNMSTLTEILSLVNSF